MTAEELREKNDAELAVLEKEWREQLFRLRFQLAGGQAESIKKIRELRKDIARLLTVRRQKETEPAHGRK